MPEGDTVYLAARRMHGALAGSSLTTGELRVASLADTDLSGATVRSVDSYGKHLLIRFTDGRTLHTHFRMDGTWHLYESDERWRGGPMHQVRAILRTCDRVAVGYRLHDMAVLATDREPELLGHLGPDILDDDFPVDVAVERIRQRPERSIATALVDQRNLAGIGNIYRTEALFLCGTDPRTPVSDIDTRDLANLVERARTLMMRNRGRASQSTTGDERRAHHVYGRTGQQCRRCGTRIKGLRMGELPKDQGAANEQLVAWCPSCQGRNTVDAGGTSRSDRTD